MTTVAEQLQGAREAKGVTINQIAEVTKIRTDHLRALEEGNFNAFSAPVYIRGFVRTYATLLKLDVNQVMSALDAELGRTDKFREPPPLTEEKRGALDFVTLQLSKLNWRIGVAGLAVTGGLGILIGGVVIWRHHQRADPLANLSPGVYQPAPFSVGETLPLPAPPKR
jgi:cytoskeleton protein RodZ